VSRSRPQLARRALAADAPCVLCVGDERYVLEGLRDSLRRSFDVHVAHLGLTGHIEARRALAAQVVAAS